MGRSGGRPAFPTHFVGEISAVGSRRDARASARARTDIENSGTEIK